MILIQYFSMPYYLHISMCGIKRRACYHLTYLVDEQSIFETWFFLAVSILMTTDNDEKSQKLMVLSNCTKLQKTIIWYLLRQINLRFIDHFVYNTKSVKHSLHIISLNIFSSINYIWSTIYDLFNNVKL